MEWFLQGFLSTGSRDGKLQVLLGKNGVPPGKRQPQNCWNIPKGHVQKGEVISDTALRQFREETSLQMNQQDLVGSIPLRVFEDEIGKDSLHLRCPEGLQPERECGEDKVKHMQDLVSNPVLASLRL